MATAKLYNLARMTTATTGTGTITLGSAATGFLSFATAGVSDGESITYAIEDGNSREIGRGTYTAAGTTLSRTVLKSTNAGSAINLSGTAQVFITDAAEDHIAGPSSATDNAVVRFDGTGGATIQNSVVTVDDTTGTLATSGGGDLGVVTTAPWGNVFLASAKKIDFNAGDVTITHSANSLAFAGASSGYTFDAAPLPSANDGAALGASGTAWADLFLASGGVINWSAGNVTITHAAGALTVAGATTVSFGTSAAFTTGTIELGHASTNTLSASSGVLSIEGTQLMMAGKQTIYIPASAMISRTTNGAASGTAETTTNKVMIKTLDFDTSTQEFAQFSVWFPKSWNLGTVTFQAEWSHASTTTNFGVVWALEGIAFSDDDAMDTAFGTAQQVADTGGTTNDKYTTSESSAITIGGSPAAGDVVHFQVKRVPSDGSDTMAIDARLHGIRLFFTTNAATDA